MLAALRRWFEAQTLALIAYDAAAYALALHPKASFFELMDSVTRSISTSPAAGDNASVIERAAAGALARLGKLPDAR